MQAMRVEMLAAAALGCYLKGLLLVGIAVNVELSLCCRLARLQQTLVGPGHHPGQLMHLPVRWSDYGSWAASANLGSRR